LTLNFTVSTYQGMQVHMHTKIKLLSNTALSLTITSIFGVRCDTNIGLQISGEGQINMHPTSPTSVVDTYTVQYKTFYYYFYWIPSSIKFWATTCQLCCIRSLKKSSACPPVVSVLTAAGGSTSCCCFCCLNSSLYAWTLFLCSTANTTLIWESESFCLVS